MVLKKSGKRKGKNYLKTSMKEIEKPSINIEQLKLITFKNIVEGSRSINGVTWNKIKRLKGRNKNHVGNNYHYRSYYVDNLFNNELMKLTCQNCNKSFNFINVTSIPKYCSFRCQRDVKNKKKRERTAAKVFDIKLNVLNVIIIL